MPTCAYCDGRNGVVTCRDHVIHRMRWKPRARIAALVGFDRDDPQNLVPACTFCNINRITRKLLPPSWADRVEWLNTLFPSRVPWRVWDGSIEGLAVYG